MNDVTLTGSKKNVGAIHGSLIIDPSNMSITFNATSNYLSLKNGGNSVVLPDDTYTVTLDSDASVQSLTIGAATGTQTLVIPSSARQLSLGAASAEPGRKAVHVEPTLSGNGYWVVDDLGTVSAFGDAQFFGNADPATFVAGETVTSLSARPSTRERSRRMRPSAA